MPMHFGEYEARSDSGNLHRHSAAERAHLRHVAFAGSTDEVIAKLRHGYMLEEPRQPAFPNSSAAASQGGLSRTSRAASTKSWGGY